MKTKPADQVLTYVRGVDGDPHGSINRHAMARILRALANDIETGVATCAIVYTKGQREVCIRASVSRNMKLKEIKV